jgi:hypothetical protein
MKRLIKKVIKSFFPQIANIIKKRNEVNKGIQILLVENYEKILHNELSLPLFEDVEFRNYSQNGEDGILLYMFSIIGFTNKKCLEICAGDGTQCNTTNLIINHGWNGWLFDGDINNVNNGKLFFSGHPDTANYPPRFSHTWITKENVNELIYSEGLEGEIDLLSLDIDGVDYWILESLECVKPRVIVLEYQCIWGIDRSVTVPYDSKFKAGFIGQYGVYSGASLPAFVKLLRRKGYRLVGCEHNGYNAFFIRNGIAETEFPEIEAIQCIEKPFVQFARQQFLDKIKNLEWVEV